MKKITYTLVLVIGWFGYAVFESISGAAAWKDARAEFLEAGESLDPSIRFAEEVPAAENFAAIPELVGITLRTEEGEEVRDRLEALALKDETVRWPKTRGSRRRDLHLPRQTYDLDAVHTYLKETGLLEVNGSSVDPAADLYAAVSEEHGALIRALGAASDRPNAILLPLASSLHDPSTPLITEAMPQFQTLLALAKGLNLFAVSALRSDHPGEAADALNSMFRLAEASTADGKQLIAHLVAIAIRTIATESIWEGIQTKAWTSDQLLGLQTEIESARPRKDFTDSMRVELLLMLDVLDRISGGGPGMELLHAEAAPFPQFILAPWIDHNRAALMANYVDGYIEPMKQDLPYPQVGEIAEAMNQRLRNRSVWNLRSFISSVAVPALVGAVKKTAEHETTLTQAALACALERYFIDHATYPDSLQALVPDFVEALPRDPMNHQPMRYRRIDGGRYQLHSVGWDGRDNGGNEGDITWNSQPTSD
ncbi:MAG: hypothetical protein ACR2RV_14465 [Verrucomicrobiales bacterium]